MATYRLYQFEGIALPDRMTEDDLSTGQVESTLVDSVGSAFDYYGSTRRLPRRRTIAARGRYIGETLYLVDHNSNQLVDHSSNFLIAGAPGEILRARIDDLKRLVGRRGTLYRLRDSDNVLQWIQARLLVVDYVQTVANWDRVADVSATFETLMAAWREQTASSQVVSVVSGTNAVLIANDSDISIEDATLTLAASSTITSLTVTNTASGVNWTWTGTLSSGQSLTVDAGALTVRRGSTDVYSGFVLNSGHTARGWLTLAQGDNMLYATVDGSGTLTISYYRQWM